MSKKKQGYYAVKVGCVPGIYTSWAECADNVNGYPGAEYKLFSTEEEAKSYIEGRAEIKDCVSRIYTNAEAVAYVDGSYDDSQKAFAYGVIIFYCGGEERLAEKFINAERANLRNVAGEIEGAKRVMKFCLDNEITSVDLFYDYEGIEKWCTGAWRTNISATQEYKKYYNEVSKHVKVNFVKVIAHSGNKYNEVADQLAKAALGIGNQVGVLPKNNGIVANGVNSEQLNLILQMLQEDFQTLSITKESIPFGTSYKLQIAEPTKQKLTISAYDEKNKLWINGKKEDLFNQLSLYLVELLEVDEIPAFLNVVHELSIDTDVIETEFRKMFPNSYDKLTGEIGNYLHQAVYHLHVSGTMYVANYLAEPALRPLEGILKIALQENDFPIRKEDNNYDSFFVFKESNNRFEIQSQYVQEKHSKQMLDYLIRCYTFFHAQRHTMFHWDNPIAGTTDTTRILKTAEEAHPIIRDAIVLIDEYYKIKN